MMTLGVPGDLGHCCNIGLLLSAWLLPGPTFMLMEKHYFYLIAAIVLIGTIMAYIFGILGSNLI